MSPGCRRREGRAPLRQRPRRLRGDHDDPGQATEDKTIDTSSSRRRVRARRREGRRGAGSAAKIGTFDTNKELVDAIQDGKVGFAIDQQPSSRATWRWTPSGCTRPTATPSAAVRTSRRARPSSTAVQRRCGLGVRRQRNAVTDHEVRYHDSHLPDDRVENRSLLSTLLARPRSAPSSGPSPSRMLFLAVAPAFRSVDNIGTIPTARRRSASWPSPSRCS